MKFVVLIILWVIFLSGCNVKHSDSGEIEKIIVDIKKVNEAVVDSLFRIDKIVKLETRPDIIIGQINEVVLSRKNDRIVLLDNRHTKSVFLFDFHGRHINTIQHSDIEDPFRPYYMRDIAVDDTNNDIFILDSHKKRIFIYDLNGNNKNSFIALDFPAQSIKSNINGDLLIQNKSSKYQKRPILINLERSRAFTTTSFKYFGQNQDVGMYHREISNFNSNASGSIIYSNYLSDTIYKITNRSQLEPLYFIDFMGARAPHSFFHSLDNYNSWYSKFKHSDFAVKLGYFIGTQDFIMFPFYLKDQAYLYYWQFTKGEPRIYNYPDFGSNLPRAPIGFYDAGIILSLESYSLIKFIDQVSVSGYEMNNLETDLYRFLGKNEIDSEDNQILIFLKVI